MPWSLPEVRAHVTLASKYFCALYGQKSIK
jgi:hypothetical protein